MSDTIHLYRSGSHWVARFEGPHAAEACALFGTPELATGFATDADPQHVLESVRHLNPGKLVLLGAANDYTERKLSMTTILTTNNAYDTVLLVDDQERVLSAWAADRDVIADYLRDGAQADQWHTGEWWRMTDPAGEDNEDELRTIAAYGEECGRNGVIADPKRRAFWGVEEGEL